MVFSPTEILEYIHRAPSHTSNLRPIDKKIKATNRPFLPSSKGGLKCPLPSPVSRAMFGEVGQKYSAYNAEQSPPRDSQSSLKMRLSIV